MSAQSDNKDSDLDFYLRNQAMFLADFWRAGNKDLKVEIEPRSVESGCWFTATWLTGENQKRYADAQRMRLLWERVMKRFLQDERKKEQAL